MSGLTLPGAPRQVDNRRTLCHTQVVTRTAETTGTTLTVLRDGPLYWVVDTVTDETLSHGYWRRMSAQHEADLLNAGTW